MNFKDFILLLGILIKSLNDHYRCLSRFCKRRKIRIEDEFQWLSGGIEYAFLQGILQVQKSKGTENDFLNAFDDEVMASFKQFKHSTSEFVKISLPALTTMILGPLLILMYHSTTEFFWSVEHFPKLPNNNQCVSCFLTPAGLVYALSFGFAFQQALTKQGEVLDKMTTEISYIDQIATLTCKMRFHNNKTRLHIFKALKSEAIFMMTLVQNRNIASFKAKPKTKISSKYKIKQDTR